MDILFPYESVRESQSDFIKDILETIKKKDNLIAHVPTGVGKTAAIFSSIIPHIVKDNLTLFFITPRHTQHKIAVETVKDIKLKHETKVSVVDFVGKKSMCCLGGINNLRSGDFAEYCRNLVEKNLCPYYKNTFGKKGPSVQCQAVLKELESKDLHSSEFRNFCYAKGVCAYELAALRARKVNIVVADYHHILNPFIRDVMLKKMNKTLSDCVIVVDEAHNVIPKVRELSSTQLTSFSLQRTHNEAVKHGFSDLAVGLNGFLESLQSLGEEHCSKNSEALIEKACLLESLNSKLDFELVEEKLLELVKKVSETKKRSYAGTILGFMKAWEGPDEAYARIISRNKDFINISYRCLDPSLLLNPLAEEAHSVIFMSGTLEPLNFHKDLFGINCAIEGYPSPFPKDNKLTLIVPDTTTKFTARSEEMYSRIAKKIVDIVESVPGNAFVFFPSYALRDSVYKFFSNCSKTIFLEDSSMTKFDREELISKFKGYKNTGAILLGVTSGSFSEGVDLKGDLLKAVITVGLPLGRPDLETKELINYYNQKFGKGVYYGYILPAMIKTFQNAGRCIRSGTDKGVVVYLDERYTWSNYFSCFPKGEYLRVVKEPVERIKEFFKKEKN